MGRDGASAATQRPGSKAKSRKLLAPGDRIAGGIALGSLRVDQGQDIRVDLAYLPMRYHCGTFALPKRYESVTFAYQRHVPNQDHQVTVFKKIFIVE